MGTSKTIVIDGRTFTRQRAGIGTFFLEFVKSAAKYAPEIKIVIALPHNIHQSFKALEEIEGIIIDKVVFFTEKLPNIFWYHLFAKKILKKYGSKILISPHCQYPFFIGKDETVVITIHDFVYRDFPETMEWWNRISQKVSFERAVRKARKIWCNSHYTYKKLIEYFPSKKDIPCFIGLSVSDLFKPYKYENNKKLMLKKMYGIDEKFYLFVGSLEPRKNLKFLLELAPLLYKRTNIQTLIIGASKWKNKIDFSVYGKSIVVVEHFISDEELVELYNLSSCYISTSLNEGFGMPQLEAMKCGCPVVSPRNSAMIEVVGQYGTLVEGWNINDWINAIVDESNTIHTPFYSEKYDWSYIVKNLFKYIEN